MQRRPGSKKRSRYKMEMRTRTKLSTKKIMVVAASFVIVATIGLAVFFNLSDTRKAMAATAGDYRSKTTGNWSSTSTWERYNGSAWVAATAVPSSGDGAIEIQPGHTVTLTSDATALQNELAERDRIIEALRTQIAEMQSSLTQDLDEGDTH